MFVRLGKIVFDIPFKNVADSGLPRLVTKQSGQDAIFHNTTDARHKMLVMIQNQMASGRAEN